MIVALAAGVPRRFTHGAELIHGNELMSAYRAGYDRGQRFGQREHRIDLVFACLEAHEVGPSSTSLVPTAVAEFVGYLVLDGLIGNTDRHHENWGALQRPGEVPTLAPSYDHASSLARMLSVSKIRDRISAGHGPEHYIHGGKGGLYPLSGKKTAPIDLLPDASKLDQDDALEFWAHRVDAATRGDFERVFARFPEGWIAEESVEFAIGMLESARSRILSLVEDHHD